MAVGLCLLQLCCVSEQAAVLGPVRLCEPGQADAVSAAGVEAALPGVTCTSRARHLTQNRLQSSHSGLVSASSRGLGQNRRAASSRVTLRSLACWCLCFSFTGFPGSFRASLHTFTSVTPSCVNETVKSEQIALRGPTACDEAAKQKVWKACPENKGRYL